MYGDQFVEFVCGQWGLIGLSLDGTLSNILAMKLNAVSFFPVITSSLAS